MIYLLNGIWIGVVLTLVVWVWWAARHDDGGELAQSYPNPMESQQYLNAKAAFLYETEKFIKALQEDRLKLAKQGTEVVKCACGRRCLTFKNGVEKDTIDSTHAVMHSQQVCTRSWE